eukprot:357447-Pyramimonas_sp.AAC.1
MISSTCRRCTLVHHEGVFDSGHKHLKHVGQLALHVDIEPPADGLLELVPELVVVADVKVVVGVHEDHAEKGGVD